jgi:hypothetical protein
MTTAAILTAVSIAPLPSAFLARVRNEGVDDLGQPVKRVVAQGGEPCRDALRRAQPGENLLLASFSPFTLEGPYREFGPVFVLAAPDREEPRRDGLPSVGGENDYLRDRFVIRAYSAQEEIVDASLSAASEFEQTVASFLESDRIAFLHVRFPTYGCFALRIDRA